MCRFDVPIIQVQPWLQNNKIPIVQFSIQGPNCNNKKPDLRQRSENKVTNSGSYGYQFSFSSNLQLQPHTISQLYPPPNLWVPAILYYLKPANQKIPTKTG